MLYPASFTAGSGDIGSSTVAFQGLPSPYRNAAYCSDREPSVRGRIVRRSYHIRPTNAMFGLRMYQGTTPRAVQAILGRGTQPDIETTAGTAEAQLCRSPWPRPGAASWMWTALPVGRQRF
jgi:hypothetical protein